MREHTSSQVGGTKPGRSASRCSTCRRCSSISEQMISASHPGTAMACATARDSVRVAATGFTESAMTGVTEAEVIRGDSVGDLVADILKITIVAHA